MSITLKKSNEFFTFLFLGRFGLQGSTEHLCSFFKVSYLWGCFFHNFMSQTNIKVEVLYTLATPQQIVETEKIVNVVLFWVKIV